MLAQSDSSQPPTILINEIHSLIPLFEQFVQQAKHLDHRSLITEFQELIDRSLAIKKSSDRFTAYIDHG